MFPLLISIFSVLQVPDSGPREILILNLSFSFSGDSSLPISSSSL